MSLVPTYWIWSCCDRRPLAYEFEVISRLEHRAAGIVQIVVHGIDRASAIAIDLRLVRFQANCIASRGTGAIRVFENAADGIGSGEIIVGDGRVIHQVAGGIVVRDVTVVQEAGAEDVCRAEGSD